MQKGDQRYVFADCAINIELDAEGMAEVAVESAHTAKVFDIDPKVALLSFSTKGSAKGEMVTKVADATKLAQELHQTCQLTENYNLTLHLFLKSAS